MQPHYSSRPYVTPPGTITGDDWLVNAACMGLDPEVWFPDPSDMDTTSQAVHVCWACPVRDACREAAMAEEGTVHAAARHGIRGGLTPMQRFNLYRRRSRKQARIQQ